jgi:glycogen debranching enzyme
MSSPFNGVGDAMPGKVDELTLVNGRTFLVSGADGALTRPSHGVVFEDLRMLSSVQVRFGTADPTRTTISRQLLGVTAPTPFHAVFVSRPDPHAASELRELYVHRQWIGRGIRHDIELHNTGDQPIRRTVTTYFDTDFAHVFDMKAGRRGTATTRLAWERGVGRLSDVADDGRVVEIRAEPSPTDVEGSAKQLAWDIECEPRKMVVVSVSFEPCWDRQPAGIAFPIGTAASQAWPATRLDHWRRVAPTLVTDDARLSVAIGASIADLASLRIFDRHHAERVVVAAGAPWFMTLFGRDSLITSWMVLPFLPELAIGTIDTLAELQGTGVHPKTEEEPGRILHELRRHGGDAAFANRGRYFGTVDATPLFVMVVGEAARWGHLPRDELAARWPSVWAAVGWIRRGIEAGNGFLRYRRSTNVGLVNQGWKDSWDGVSFADGRLPDGPIALAEVQGYAYAALRAAAELSEHVGDATRGEEPSAQMLRLEADQLAERFDAAFWIEPAASYAVALDGDDRLVDSVTTNPGHAIWCGIADPTRANRYLDRILDDDLFSGWGLRTLSPTGARYDPLSYHNGSVWPHDTAIVAAGAARIGRRDVVRRLFDAALDAAARTGGRPPELFAGLDRDVVDIPVPYPSSCSPQAWASASILLHLRSSLGLEPPTSAAHRPRISADGPEMASVTGIRVGTDRFVISRNDGAWNCAPESDDH